jgi:hypothetical protein
MLVTGISHHNGGFAKRKPFYCIYEKNMLQQVIQKARTLTTEKDFLDLILQHHDSPINTAIIIENCIRAGQYRTLHSAIDTVFIQQYNRWDKKLRGIVLNAFIHQSIDTTHLIRRFEQPHFFMIALKHEGLALPTLSDTKAQEYSLHQDEYHNLTIRNKEIPQREKHIKQHLLFQQEVFNHDTKSIQQTLTDH